MTQQKSRGHLVSLSERKSEGASKNLFQLLGNWGGTEAKTNSVGFSRFNIYNANWNYS